MRAWKLIPLVLLLLTQSARAEVSIWLKKGVSGFGGGAAFRANEHGSMFELSGGYSYKGWIDFDLALRGYSFDSDEWMGFDMGAFSLAPSVEVHPIKQGASFPVSVGLSVGVEEALYESDVFGPDDGIEAFSVFGGVAVYRFIRLAERIGITPAAGVTVSHTTVTTKVSGFETSADDTSVGGTVGGYIAYLDDAGRIWGVVPTVSFNDDFVQFGIGLDLIFSRP